MKNRQQLNYSQHQYIHYIYCKLLYIQYLQNLSSVICSTSSGIAGNITHKNTEHGNYTYGYDDLDRLTSADYPTLTDESFTYDSLGNRKTDSSTGVTQWLYNQNNQLLNSVNNQFNYDANGSQIEEKGANGQLLKQYIYNTENRLAEIKDANGQTISTYYYDPFGRRLSKTIANPDASTTITYFHYNDEGYSAEKTNGQIISYLFSPQNTWSTSPILKRENNTYYYYQNDHLGTPNIIHDKQGQVVNSREMKAFGQWSSSANVISNNFAFAGQYKDRETNTYYNYFRNYYPNSGRYITQDPLGFSGGNNFFQYANSDTISLIDVNGLKVTGSWAPPPTLEDIDISFSCSSGYGCIDFGSDFDWLFAVGFHIEGSAKLKFGVTCTDDCPKDSWEYSNYFNLEASYDSQFAPPIWCGLFGYALKRVGAKNIHVSTAAFSCWTALIINASNALPRAKQAIKEVITSKAIPIIATLIEMGPVTLCLQHRN